MLWSRTLIPTLKETPEGAEAASHVLMLRAGLVAQVMAGAYAWLPLGLRALDKLAALVRGELDAAGGLEVSLPAMTPLGQWERSGRAEEMASELVQLTLHRQDRKARVVLAPSHEEAIAELAAHYVASYRQLPLLLYEIGPRFRNEERPRQGLLRTCEYTAASAYSFDASQEALGASYEKVLAAFRRVLERLGLECLVAEAEGDPAGAAEAHELVVPAGEGAAGDETIVHCAACGYAGTMPCARIGARDCTPPDVAMEELRQVDTPGAATIDEVSRFLGCPPQQLVKTLLYLADGRPVAVLVRGDHEASEAKIRLALDAKRLELADPATIERVTGAPVGFAGPVGMKERLPLWADVDVGPLRNVVVGANRGDAHLVGVNLGRDFQPDRFADLRAARDGDPCPRCSSNLALRRAIEVGHLFKLGARFSEPLGLRFRDPDEGDRAVVMGSFHLGLGRLLAAVVESHHDEHGIVWPPAVAPYAVAVLPLSVGDPQTMAVAGRLHDELSAAGIDVLLDDRDARPGVKFNDADLVGIPLRVVIGDRGLKQGKLEVKWRWSAEKQLIQLEGAAGVIGEMVRGRE